MAPAPGESALFAAREKRPRPHLDDKVLTAWNGLMIAAFARAARMPDSPAAAIPGGRATGGAIHPRHAVAPGRASSAAALSRWRRRDRRLRRGLRLSDVRAARTVSGRRRSAMARLGGGAADEPGRRFWDEQDGGWFSTTGDDPTVLLRLKEDYDGAEPAASSVAVLNLLTLAHLTGAEGALEKVERTLARLGPRIGAAARAVPMMLCALSAWQAGLTRS